MAQVAFAKPHLSQENVMKIIAFLASLLLLIGCVPSKSDLAMAKQQQEREQQSARNAEMSRLQDQLQGNPLEVQGSTLVFSLISKPAPNEVETATDVMSCWLVGLGLQEHLFTDVRFVAPNYDTRGMDVVATIETPLPRTLTPPNCKPVAARTAPF